LDVEGVATVVGGVVADVVEDVFDDELELHAPARPAVTTNASGTSLFTGVLTSCSGTAPGLPSKVNR
jgi:hypothetical protein